MKFSAFILRVVTYKSCRAGQEVLLKVDKLFEPYTLTLDDFSDRITLEYYARCPNISTTHNTNLLSRTRPVSGEFDRQMRFDNSLFETRNPVDSFTPHSFTPHSFAATGQPKGEFQATIRDVPNDQTRIIFEMIADFFQNGSTTFQFELDVYDIDRDVIVFTQILEESYMDL